nr:immunoglobulin light chain junction region [Macaca mulatta]MOV74470.1 immunoglobulin light chain junction region [Macaca mulatta]MOV74616.1 immunoglobulin light chain junction region [Macaca mulatta]MOV74716.1 immunoglobulin light chain junction region [Macaca mulatta]MOV74791.1 immunoglobulin light chain junction region [Macaca mulatta]
CQQDYSFLFTF